MGDTLASYISKIPAASIPDGQVLTANAALPGKFGFASPGGGGGGGSYPSFCGVVAYLLNNVLCQQASGGLTTLAFDAADPAPAGLTHNTGTGAITISTTGTYRVSFCASLSANNFGWIAARLKVSGTVKYSEKLQGYSGYISDQNLSFSTILSLTAGDVLTLEMYATSCDWVARGYTAASEPNAIKTYLSVERIA